LLFPFILHFLNPTLLKTLNFSPFIQNYHNNSSLLFQSILLSYCRSRFKQNRKFYHNRFFFIVHNRKHLKTIENNCNQRQNETKRTEAKRNETKRNEAKRSNP
jgi:hypothetical protein